MNDTYYLMLSIWLSFIILLFVIYRVYVKVRDLSGKENTLKYPQSIAEQLDYIKEKEIMEEKTK